MFPEMEEERDAAELVKRDKTILVVLGNPPYYAFAGVSPEEEQGLVEPYKEGLASEWKIRKYNLDELPQFLNVLQGRMSIVGPRPHAVAHNELYRKLIRGYMIRHKVRPGITGLAQVNGLRGETDTLEKMQARIECDLDYLRNWSLLLDIRLMLNTISVVLGKTNSY